MGVVGGTGAVAHASYNQAQVSYSYQYASTMQATVSNCDDCVATVNLPFAFPYWGRSYSQLTISSNGFVVLGAATSSSFSNVPFGVDGTAAAPGPVIAPLWDDWNTSDTGGAGTIYYGQVGSAFVVEWWGVYHFGQTTGATTTFELKLFPDGRIEFHYGNMATGNAGWDYGASATVGFQEDVDTIGQPVSFNAATVGTSTARGFTRPGTVALYVKAKDGFYSPPRVRQNLYFGQSVNCGSYWSWVGLSTGPNEWTAAFETCPGGTLYNNLGAPWDTLGYDLATIPMSPITDVTHGQYRFIKRSDFTPQPVANQRRTVGYGSGSFTSKLDYWQGGGAIDKTLLIVTGFDPLNESSTAQYLVLMGDLARAALAEGRDIAIGKFGDGNQRLSWYDGEVGAWAADAYARSGNRKVQVAGVSMGGAVTRRAAYYNAGGFNGYVRAWYSVDAPQTGANLGRGYRGIQNLILCNKSASDPQYKMIFSNSAADMMTLRVSSCSCDNEPENSTCSSTTQYHDEYYNSFGWPTSTPRYALAFGDGNASGGYSKMGSGKLFDFTYTGWFCSEDRDWNGGQRDCNAGSRYMDGAMVNTDEDASLCGNFKLRLSWEPAFINVDSALGVATSLSSETEDGGCASSYPTLGPTYWTGWASNTYNEKHTTLSSGLLSQTMTWIRQNDP